MEERDTSRGVDGGVDVGVMSVCSGFNGAGTGSTSVTVHGAGLGLMALTAMRRAGQSPDERPVWKVVTSRRSP